MGAFILGIQDIVEILEQKFERFNRRRDEVNGVQLEWFADQSQVFDCCNSDLH
jgi:hypothetical protein